MPSTFVIADDLSGALDASACFARRGHLVQVALSPDCIPDAIQSGADVISISTGSREGTEENARAQVRAALNHIPADAHLIKKVDSRLKGHVAAETEEMLSRGYKKLVVAPAIPKLGRLVEGGQLTGSGVTNPQNVVKIFAGLSCDVSVPDISSDADLDVSVSTADSSTLFVGASGLTDAIARAEGNTEEGFITPKSARVLIAIGSRDPITLAQVTYLLETRHDTEVISCPNGKPPLSIPDASVVLIQMTQAAEKEPSSVVTDRFSQTIADVVSEFQPNALIASGGETAQGILTILGINTLKLVGEASTGVPVSECNISGRPLNILTKSGGFGEPALLADLLGALQS